MQNNDIKFNKSKVVLDLNKLQSFLAENMIDMNVFLEKTIDDVYEFNFSEEKNKLNIKRKATQKQKDSSKNNLKKANKVAEKVNNNDNLLKINNQLNEKVINLEYEVLRLKLSEENRNENSQDFYNSGISESNVRSLPRGGDEEDGPINETLDFLKGELEAYGIMHIETLDDIIMDVIELFKIEQQVKLIFKHLEKGMIEMNEENNVMLFTKRALEVFRAMDDEEIERLENDD